MVWSVAGVFVAAVLATLACIGVPVVLIARQPDVGTALTFDLRARMVQHLHQLLQEVFEPLTIRLEPGTTAASVVRSSGAELVVPLPELPGISRFTEDAGAFVLGDAQGGRLGRGMGARLKGCPTIPSSNRNRVPSGLSVVHGHCRP